MAARSMNDGRILDIFQAVYDNTGSNWRQSILTGNIDNITAKIVCFEKAQEELKFLWTFVLQNDFEHMVFKHSLEII